MSSSTRQNVILGRSIDRPRTSRLLIISIRIQGNPSTVVARSLTPNRNVFVCWRSSTDSADAHYALINSLVEMWWAWRLTLEESDRKTKQKEIDERLRWNTHWSRLTLLLYSEEVQHCSIIPSESMIKVVHISFRSPPLETDCRWLLTTMNSWANKLRKAERYIWTSEGCLVNIAVAFELSFWLTESLSAVELLTDCSIVLLQELFTLLNIRLRNPGSSVVVAAAAAAVAGVSVGLAALVRPSSRQATVTKRYAEYDREESGRWRGVRLAKLNNHEEEVLFLIWSKSFDVLTYQKQHDDERRNTSIWYSLSAIDNVKVSCTHTLVSHQYLQITHVLSFNTE